MKTPRCGEVYEARGFRFNVHHVIEKRVYFRKEYIDFPELTQCCSVTLKKWNTEMPSGSRVRKSR